MLHYIVALGYCSGCEEQLDQHSAELARMRTYLAESESLSQSTDMLRREIVDLRGQIEVSTLLNLVAVSTIRLNCYPSLQRQIGASKVNVDLCGAVLLETNRNRNKWRERERERETETETETEKNRTTHCNTFWRAGCSRLEYVDIHLVC